MVSAPPGRHRLRPRAAVFALVTALVVGLAVLPAVAADGPGGGDVVTVCHQTDDGYQSAQAPETDFYGTSPQGHGTHSGDIVPPFVVEKPAAGDPASFPGRNWDKQAIYDVGCVEAAAGDGGSGSNDSGANDNEKKHTICHSTSSSSNPYVLQSPAIANNGDLQGGHLNHTGPVYPTKGWGDIIPPYTYVDADGKTQTYPGMNWSPEGQAIFNNGCEPVQPPQPKTITPLLQCVEQTANGFLAHFGYDNPNGTTIEVPLGDQNRFSPGDGNRGQPTAFAAGRVEEAVQVAFDGSALTWTLTTEALTVSSSSRRCQGSITVAKRLVPSSNTGRFALRIDGEVAGGAAAVGDGGSTGTIAVDTGRHAVSETAASGTQLGDYTIETVCRTNGGQGNVVAQANGPSVEVGVGRNEAIVCTISNTAKSQPATVSPILECVLFSDTSPDVAYWGYRNSGANEVKLTPGGETNRFNPAPAVRGQPGTFEPGRQVGAFQTPFEASSGTLVWSLSGRTATAGSGSAACNPTIEVRKVTVPADDPGVFQLRINGTVVATGGNGATSGTLRIGVGEGTVSETAGPGTSLTDYDSRVRCTRNGTVAVSVPGTKVDGAVAARDVVICTFTNTRKGTPPQPEPPQPEPPQPPNPPIPPIPPLPPGPAPLLDLVVVKSVAPEAVSIGGRLTWTMTVTNRSAIAAADVNGLKLNDPNSYRTRLVSLTSSQGTCRPFTCDLGRLAPGASATVTAVTVATQVGLVVNIVRVGSEEQESNYRNNVAAALARVTGPLTPPVGLGICRTLTAEPRVLQSARSSVVRLKATNRLGKPLAGVPVRARGAGVDAQARTDRQGIARLPLAPSRAGLMVFTGGDRTTAGRGSQCRTLLGVLGASSTQVTG